VRVLFLTDSLGLPRLDPEPIFVDETWTYKLEKLIRSKVDGDLDISYYCVSGLQSDQVLDACKGVVAAFRADIVVIQQGIVDCYPRALKKNEVSVISRLPFFGLLIRKAVKKWYKEIVELRNITYISPEEFSENWKEIKVLLPPKLIIIPIAPANSSYMASNPLIDSNITQYNEIFSNIFQDQFIEDAYAQIDLDRCFLSDNHHLSVYANEKLAELAYSRLLRLM
jgi:hypothetical protein